MKPPFAYVLFIEQSNAEPMVLLHQTLDETEDALRDFAATQIVGPGDDDLVEALAEECGVRVRIFACTLKRNTQVSTELEPFTHAEAA